MSMKRDLSFDDLNISQDANALKSMRTSTKPVVLKEEDDERTDETHEETGVREPAVEERADLNQLLDGLQEARESDDEEEATEPKSQEPKKEESQEVDTEKEEGPVDRAGVVATMSHSKSDLEMHSFINAPLKATPAENVKKLRDYIRETSEMMIAKEIYDKRIETNTGKINNLEETLAKVKQRTEADQKEQGLLAELIETNQTAIEQIKKELLFSEIDLLKLARVSKK